MIECTHGTLPSMEVSSSPICYDQDAIEIPIQVLEDVVKESEEQNHEEVITLTLET